MFLWPCVNARKLHQYTNNNIVWATHTEISSQHNGGCTAEPLTSVNVGKESGIQNPESKFYWQRLESGLHSVEFTITPTIKIRNPSSTGKTLESSTWNPETTVWNPESAKTVLDSLTWDDKVKQRFII